MKGTGIKELFKTLSSKSNFQEGKEFRDVTYSGIWDKYISRTTTSYKKAK